MVMLACSPLRLGPAQWASSARSIRTKATLMRTEWKWSLLEAIQNLVTLVRQENERAITENVADFDDLLINVRN